MSIAKAMRVRRAARKDTRDEMSVTVMCCEKERSRAKKVTTAAVKVNNALSV